MKIVFTGGGTGGHVYPLVAVIREIRRIYIKDNLELCYVGPNDDFGLALLSEEDVTIKTIASGKLRRYFSFKNIIDLVWGIPLGMVQSFFILFSLKPDLVLSKGGSGSFAVASAARVLGIPVFLHESDVVPGLSNQKAAPFAKKIFISFPKTEYFDRHNTMLTGNPIRQEILEGDKEHAGELFSLTFSKPIFLILGGSQGAEPINDFILNILNDLLKKYELIHVTGTANFKETSAEAQVVMEDGLQPYYHPIGFLNEEKLKHAYKAADLVISRSGSGSIFEIAAVGKPSILVPLPSAAGNHQSKNAYAYGESGACLILEQENLTPHFFMEQVDILFLQPERLTTMSQGALSFAKPLAARAVARELLEFLLLI